MKSIIQFLIIVFFSFLNLFSFHAMASKFDTRGEDDTIFVSSFETDCTLIINPGDDFDSAFSLLVNGDTLCLNDGVYNQAMDIPSFINVRAVNVGMAEIDGDNTLGEQWSGGLLQMLGTDSSVRGLKVYQAGTNVNTCQVTGSNHIFRNMSCSHGGTHKHKVPLRVGGTGHLIEDSWFYGEGRYVVQCFIGDHTIFRRNVARWDATTPNEQSEPNATFANYNCSNITWENNISLDYGIPETPMLFGGDFYSPHNLGVYPEMNHDNHWFGNMVINHATNTNNNRAFRADNNHSQIIPGGIIKDFYMRDSSVDFVIKSNYEFIITACTEINVATQNVICDENADIQHKYLDGIKTQQLLWPWKNEALIKRDFCDINERQSDWCLTDQSLSEYVLDDS